MRSLRKQAIFPSFLFKSLNISTGYRTLEFIFDHGFQTYLSNVFHIDNALRLPENVVQVQTLTKADHATLSLVNSSVFHISLLYPIIVLLFRGNNDKNQGEFARWRGLYCL